MTRRWSIRILAVYLLLLPSPSIYAVDGRVRASLEETKQVWVGQRVLLNVDLLTTGYSFSDQHFQLPEKSGAL